VTAEIFVNFSQNPVRDYVTWSPTRCAIRSTDNVARTVLLTNGGAAPGGEVVFLAAASDVPSDTLRLDLPAGNAFVEFHIAGRFDDAAGVGFASSTDRDASIVVTDEADGSIQATQPLMVRVRKNANTLTDEERDRFLSAIVTLNQRGDFVDFQNIHTSDTSREIHGRSCFLPWHRLYLLDLERKLQAVDPSVSLPYWRFDEPAPNLFTRDFLGVADASGLVQFSSSNPMVNWRLTVFGEGSGRIRRLPQFDTATEPAAQVQNDEAATLNLGTTGVGNRARTNFENFERMEGDPHGSAHISFSGQVSEIGRAPADPLFFMLHANVDRLWAKWQWLRDRDDPSSSDSYYKQGTGPLNADSSRAGVDRIGNYIDDTLWPWNGRLGDPRPRTAPGTYFPPSPFLSVPDRYPDIRSAIDFQGQVELSRNLGFCYDDVPFDFA